MSVFFENEFKNESENEIKNESENRCIMLPEEVKGKGYFALTGSKLKAYVEKWLDGIDEERTCYAGYSIVKVQRTDYIRQREKRRRMECAAMRSSSISASSYFRFNHEVSKSVRYGTSSVFRSLSISIPP